MKLFEPTALGDDTEAIRTTFRQVVQRSTILIAVICLLDAGLCYVMGEKTWHICLVVVLLCIPAHYFSGVKHSFPVFLTAVISIIAMVTWYCTYMAIYFGNSINFHLKLLAIIPLIAVSGRLTIRVKWTLILLFTLGMILLDYRVALTPAMVMMMDDPSMRLMRAFNFAIPLLTIAALVMHYFQLVAQQQAMLKEHATTDPLTGLMNRRRLREVWEMAEAEGRRGSFPLSIVLCDVDRFKVINDTYGHEVGDEVLRQLGHLLRKELRLTDSVCRWGGEEFLLLMPHADSVQTVSTSNRIRENIANTPMQIGTLSLSITITMGVATLQDREKFEAAAHRADVALYAGKVAGRNRVMAAAARYPDASSAA